MRSPSRILRSVLAASVSLSLCAVVASASQSMWTGQPGPREGNLPTELSPAFIGSNVGDAREEHEAPNQFDTARLAFLKTHPVDGVRLGGDLIVGDTEGDDIAARLAPTLGTNFTGLGQSGWIPYDAAIAVGPSNVLVMTNSQWAVYSKTTGAQQFITQFDPWFGNAAGGGFDPKCFYDATSARFVIMCVEQNGTKAQIDISVSKTSDPLGAWWKYTFDVTKDGTVTTTNWMDFPHMGFDDNAIYVGGNQYSFAGVYQYSKLRVFSKAQLYSGAAATFTDFTKFTDGSGSYAFALSPARSLTATTTCYMVDTNPNGATSVNLWKVTGAPSAPVLTRVATVSCGTYAVPPDASQSGTSTKIATGDCRTQDCTWRSGTMWTGWSEANASAAGVRYFTINTSTGVKIKDITYSATANYYYPAVTSDGAGNGYVVASRSSSTTFASMYRTGIKTTETTLETMASVKAGVASNTSGRWGDYSAIHNDPSNSNHVWLYAGWANSGNAWATWITDSYFTLAAPGTTGSPSPVLAAVRVSAIEENASHPSIRFSLAKAAPAMVSLYTATGRLVRRMELPSAIQGDNTAVWDGLDMHGAATPAGVYLVRVESGATRSTSRIVRM